MDQQGTGISMFQGTDLNINNSQQNVEEEEDLEDQIRRKEELQNLLTVALDEFKYEDSTIHSSANNSLEDIHQNYREANTEEQLHLLYELRVKELNQLRDEFNTFKELKDKEVSTLKRKLLLGEAEFKQQEISLKNAESLLVEKASKIDELTSKVTMQDAEIAKHQKLVEKYDVEICTYKSSLQELQMKLMDSNPFKLKSYNSEELKKIHEEEIAKLQTSLEEQTKKCEIYEREKLSLRSELNKLIEQNLNVEDEHQRTMSEVVNSFEGAQQQCKDLLDIVSMLTKENEHYRERMNKFEIYGTLVESDSELSFKDEHSLKVHCEKLKKMLLDKSVKINVLQAKLSNYEENARELGEYRQVKVDVYRKDFKTCENSSHIKDLLIMQNELQNTRKTLTDKDKQIENLNTINKELQEKIEDMILQTRNDIQNLSHKYSLPQLEVMSRDLKQAEEKILQLEDLLAESKEENVKLLDQYKEQISNKEEALKQLELANSQIKTLQKTLEKETETFQTIIKTLQEQLNDKIEAKKVRSQYKQLKDELGEVMKHLNDKSRSDATINFNTVEIINGEIEELLQQVKNDSIEKFILEEKLSEWLKLLETVSTSEGFKGLELQKKLEENSSKLKQAEDNIKKLQDTIQEITNQKTIEEGAKFSLEYQLKEKESNLAEAVTYIKQLEDEFEKVKEYKKEKTSLLNKIQELETSKLQLNTTYEQTVLELKTCQKLVEKLEQEAGELREKYLRRNLEKELRESLNSPQNTGGGDAQNLLTLELKIREELQQDYTQKISNIEKKYHDICAERTNLYKKLQEKYDKMEVSHREKLGQILLKCGEKISEFEVENERLFKKILMMKDEYETFRNLALGNEEKYNAIIINLQKEQDKKIEAWKTWSTNFVQQMLNVESLNRKVRSRLFERMDQCNEEVAALELQYNSKIKQYVRKI